MRRPLGVLFDFGDTVLRGESNLVAGNRRLLELSENALNLTGEDIQLVADKINKELQGFRDESMIEIGLQSFQRLLFETLGISFNISYSELEREFWQAAVKYTPTDGIFDVLDKLEDYRIKTGILSNSAWTGAVMEGELARHNLAHRFSFLISSADYVFRKPHRRIFEVAVRKMNLKPEDIWFVGDQLEYDVKGAIDYGLYPVWYNPRNEPGRMDYEYLEVRDWYEFRDKLESLCGD
jgi:putative hydrolase of the HAD superfamily